MKKLSVIILSLFFLGSLSAQNYQDSIAYKFCDCFNDVDPVNIKNSETRIAMCLFLTLSTYNKEIYRDYKVQVNIDLEEDSLFNLFILTMPKMAEYCPKSFDLFGQMFDIDNTPEKVELVGEIIKIEKENFVVFSVLDDKNMTHNVYWMEPVYTNIDLVTEYNNLIGKKLYVDYIEKEFYDPKIEQYRKFKILQSLQLEIIP